MLDMSRGTHRAASNWLPQLAIPPNELRPHVGHGQGGILKLRPALGRRDHGKLVAERPGLTKVDRSIS
jgi:hypothetical protein